MMDRISNIEYRICSVNLKETAINSHYCIFEIFVNLTLGSIEIFPNYIFPGEVFFNSPVLFFGFIYFLSLLFGSEWTKF